VNSPFFGWCFDTGHANRCGLPQTSLLGLSHPPMSLHVQDNHGDHDEHLLPGDGTIDWKVFLDTLHAIDYTGDLVLEAHHQSIDAPDDRRDTILTDLLHRAEKMLAYYRYIHP
jgi:sugar phosphate isomerase/epimerase